ncbi:MAG: hypothetical protein OIF55_19190 [Amphritea sp.]|nr:hypothetical protein [Amphritea sp.]
MPNQLHSKTAGGPATRRDPRRNAREHMAQVFAYHRHNGLSTLQAAKKLQEARA